MPRIPLCDAFGPCALVFDSLPARRSHDLKRRAEPLGQIIGDCKCCERRLRAVQPDHDPVQVPALTPSRASDEYGARRFVQERASRLAGQHAEEATAAPTTERQESGVVLLAGMPQDPLRIASYDLGRAVGSVAHDLDRLGASTSGLFFELSNEVVHLEAGVSGNRRVESGDGECGRAIRTQCKRLMQRFETEVGSVNTHDNPIEHTHEPILAEPERPEIRADTEPSTYVSLLTFASLRSALRAVGRIALLTTSGVNLSARATH